MHHTAAYVVAFYLVCSSTAERQKEKKEEPQAARAATPIGSLFGLACDGNYYVLFVPVARALPWHNRYTYSNTVSKVAVTYDMIPGTRFL